MTDKRLPDAWRWRFVDQRHEGVYSKWFYEDKYSGIEALYFGGNSLVQIQALVVDDLPDGTISKEMCVPRTPQPREVWRHKKTGHAVTVLYIGKMQHTNKHPKFVSELDMQDTVIYSYGGTVWTRLLSEFTDGRFEWVGSGVPK